jgi:hypothetical protein
LDVRSVAFDASNYPLFPIRQLDTLNGTSRHVPELSRFGTSDIEAEMPPKNKVPGVVNSLSTARYNSDPFPQELF